MRRKGTARIKGEDLTLKLTRTSNAYDKDDLGVKSVGGAMVEFDMQPDRSSWELSSSSYRPGLGAPSAEGGKAEYDTGKKDSIGKKWRENPAKGNKAKIYDQNGEWIGEWVGGQPATYFYGKREDKERTSGWPATVTACSFGTTTEMASSMTIRR